MLYYNFVILQISSFYYLIKGISVFMKRQKLVSPFQRFNLFISFVEVIIFSVIIFSVLLVPYFISGF